MPDLDEHTLTDAVVARLDACPDPRLKATTAALVRHLHAFVRETQPTEAEWMAAIRFLTAVGQMCDDRRQEFILLSDTLGVSMLVDAINHPHAEGATETTVLGPFYVAGAPVVEHGGDIAAGRTGTPLFCHGRITAPDGRPIAGAVIDVWQADEAGLYDVQRPGAEPHLRGRLRSDAAGRYAFWSIVPACYPIPTDGPVGRLLTALERHPFRPAHVHFRVEAAHHEPLVTHVYVAGDPYLDSDVVLGVKASLVRALECRPAGAETAGRVVEVPHRVMSYDLALRSAAPARTGS